MPLTKIVDPGLKRFKSFYPHQRNGPLWLPDQYSHILFIGEGIPSKHSQEAQARQDSNHEHTQYGKKGRICYMNRARQHWKYDPHKAAAHKRGLVQFDGRTMNGPVARQKLTISESLSQRDYQHTAPAAYEQQRAYEDKHPRSRTEVPRMLSIGRLPPFQLKSIGRVTKEGRMKPTEKKVLIKSVDALRREETAPAARKQGVTIKSVGAVRGKRFEAKKGSKRRKGRRNRQTSSSSSTSSYYTSSSSSTTSKRQRI